MTNYHILLVGLLAAPALAASGPAPKTSAATAQSQASDAPAARMTLVWTSTDISSFGGTWDSYTATAAGWVEGGYSDWRLPSVAELQAAVQNGSFGTMTANVNWLLWTSDTQGRNNAYAVVVVTDASGNPIASQSGQSRKVLKASNLRAKFVRP